MVMQTNGKKKVYLAGGMRSEWRETIKAAMSAEWLGLTQHGLKDEKQYTAWDLQAINDCDILFGFLEFNNPSGLGLMLEIGYAAALGKTIIFVDDKPEVKKYTGMARAISGRYAFTTLVDGMLCLMQLLDSR